MSIVLDGSAGVTFPNGSNPQAAPSKVLQVVQATTTGSSTTSSTSFVNTNLTATITPLFSTSKMLVIVSGGDFDTQTNGRQGWATIYRNSTNIGNGSTGISDWYNAGARQIGAISMILLDSPATTSSTTYSLYVRSDGSGSIICNGQQGIQSITVMEIAQ